MLDFTDLIASGDSLLQYNNLEGVTSGFLFCPNEAHKLARAEVHLIAPNFEGTERGAQYIVLPYISHTYICEGIALPQSIDYNVF